MDDEHVRLGTTGHVGGHRPKQTSRYGAEPQISDDEQVGANLDSQINQCIDRGAYDRAFLDVDRAGFGRTVTRVAQDVVARRTAGAFVSLVLEDVGRVRVPLRRPVRR